MPSAQVSNYLIMFTRMYIGENDSLGRSSIFDMLLSLSEGEFVPRVIAFWNNSVKACIKGSKAVSYITKLEQIGVRILVMAHALDELGLKTELCVGKLAGYFDLFEAVNSVQKVLTF